MVLGWCKLGGDKIAWTDNNRDNDFRGGIAR